MIHSESKKKSLEPLLKFCIVSDLELILNQKSPLSPTQKKSLTFFNDPLSKSTQSPLMRPRYAKSLPLMQLFLGPAIKCPVISAARRIIRPPLHPTAE